MSKSGFVKLISLVAVTLSLALLLSLGAFASPSIKVSYNYGGYVHDEFVEAGTEFLPMTPTAGEGDILVGWIDNRGNIYKMGEKASFEQSTSLYLVAGAAVCSAEEILSAVQAGKTYIKLTDDVTLNSQLELNNGVFVIDTNGYTLSINTEGEGIVGKNTGVAFIGGGSVVHTMAGANPSFVLDSFISLSPMSTFNTMFVSVGAGTSVSTNIDFISVENNISKYDGVFSASVFGTLTCERFMRTNGISGAAFDIYAGAAVNTGCEYFFEDLSESSADRFVTLTIHGGTINTDRLNGYAKDYTKYQAAILGGSFSEDITPCFPDGNYEFKLNSNTGLYDFVKCEHDGPIISGIPEQCEVEAYLTYKCKYCNVEETKKEFVGHTRVTTVEQELVATKEMTRKGILKHYCQKCGQAEYEVFYPRPSEVYVDAVILDLKGRPQNIRVPAKELFSFDATITTQINSFSAEYIQAEFNVTQERIVSVEIPLGTTSVYGYIHNSVPVGAFCRNQHLEEIIIPETVTHIKKYAFNNMEKLKTIKGIENITGIIEEYAFSQDHTNVLIDQLILRAKTVNKYAFENITMNSLIIDRGVTSISEGAFYLDYKGGIEANKDVKEVIVVGCPTDLGKGLPVPVAIKDYRSEITFSSSYQQFGANPVAFGDHQYNVTVQKADCHQEGYTFYECKYCSKEKTEDQTPKLSHNFEKNVHVPPTCLTQGYTVENKCSICGDEIGERVVSEKRDPNAHDFTFGTVTKFMNFIEGSFVPNENGNVCENYHYVVGKCKCGALDTSVKVPTSFSQLTAPLNPSHSFDEKNYVVIKQPNCGETGIAVVSCTTCGKEIKGILPVSGEAHKWSSKTDIVKKPNCTEQGTERFTCTVCNSTRDRTMKIDANNHVWGTPYVLQASTETVMGIEQVDCTLCGASSQNRLERLEAKKTLPVGWLVAIIIGGVLLTAGIVLTLYFTLFKKKKASDGYKYNFNTLGK